MRLLAKLLSVLCLCAVGACADGAGSASGGYGGGASRPDVAAMKAQFQTRANAFKVRTGDGPGRLAGGIVGRFLSVPANDIQQRFTKYLGTDQSAHKHWEYFETLLEVDGSSGYRLYRVGLRGHQTPLTIGRFSDPWYIGIDDRAYWLAKPRSLVPDAEGWVWSEWHYDPREPGALYTDTERRTKFDPGVSLQMRKVYASVFAKSRKRFAEIRKQLVVGKAATDFALRKGGDAKNRLAALDQAGQANADYRAFQKRVNRDDRRLGKWMSGKNCAQPQARFDKYDSAKNSFNQGRALEAEAKCMMERSASWDPEPWIKAHAVLAAEEAELFARTAEIKRAPVMDAAALYAQTDTRITEIWAKANREYADGKRYARQYRIAEKRRAAANAANAQRLIALNAAINNVLRSPGAGSKYRRTAARSGSGSASSGGSITLTSRSACPQAGQKQTRFGCMTNAEFSAEQARIADHDARYQAYQDNWNAIQKRAPDKPDTVKNPNPQKGSRSK